MLETLRKNFKTLRNALGSEPLGQILANAFRKVLGQSPVLQQEIAYKDYYKTKDKEMQQKYGELDINTDIVILWFVSSLDIARLQQTLETIKAQTYTHFSIKLISPHPRIKTMFNELEHYESFADALLDVTAPYVGLIQDTIWLYPNFVHAFAHQVQTNKFDIGYACHDYISTAGDRSQPQFKPQLNVDLLYASNYIGQHIFIRRDFGAKSSWFETDNFPSAFVYDFLLRSLESAPKIQRIPEILYGLDPNFPLELIAERKLALAQHLKRSGWDAKVLDGIEAGMTRVKRKFEDNPVVSIIIPFRDKVELLEQCVSSIISTTSYQNYEIILVDNGSTAEATKAYIAKVSERLNVHYLRLNIPFNFSALNNAAAQKASGDYLLFLNNDTQVIQKEWLSAMVEELQRPDVGVVGAKLLYEDGTVQHAGVLLGVGHIAGHSFRNLDDTDGGHMQRANLTQQYLAVTGACLLTKKELFLRVGGFDEVHLQVAYNDVDYCLSIHQLGYKIIYTPHAKLYHFESKSRMSDLSEKESDRYNKECIFMKEKWGEAFALDPFHHPDLGNNSEDFRIRKNA